LAAHLSVQIERAREPEFRIGFREGLPGIRFNERLLVRDELVQDLIADIALSCLNAIAYPARAGVVIAIMEDTRCDRLRWFPR
jgi:hypothetical protein